VNVHLATLERWSKGVLLVRLSHQFAIGEDPSLSLPVAVDLGQLLARWGPLAVVEMSLTVNQRRDDMLRRRVVWNTTDVGVGARMGARMGEGASGSTKASERASVRVAEDRSRDRQGPEGRVEGSGEEGVEGETTAANPFLVHLLPMEVRTWLVQVQR
jgi:hypothetical protein